MMARLEFNAAEDALWSQAEHLEIRAKDLRDRAIAMRRERDCARPDRERLIFAARTRCLCGHGMAYDPAGKLASNADGPFRVPSQWECSAILLGIADQQLTHQGPLPFAFYEIKSENQPSAYGWSTREPGEPHPDALPKDAA